MSENLNLGQIITTPQNRDAIHIAVVPVVAAMKLQPGDKVWLDDGKAALGAINSIGVVDPFLTVSVKPGETFWLYLNPGSITSLRHEWTHSAFSKAEAEQHAARLYLADFADRLGSNLTDMLGAINDGHFCLPDDIDYPQPELDAVFWANYTAYTGRPQPSDTPDYFRCAC